MLVSWGRRGRAGLRVWGVGWGELGRGRGMCQRRSSGEEAAEKRVSVWGGWVGSFGPEVEGGG